MSALPCLALPILDTLKLLFGVTSSSLCSSLILVCDRRPDLNRKWCPFFHHLVFLLFEIFCLSVPRHGSRHSSSRLSPLQVGVGVCRDHCETQACRQPASSRGSSPHIMARSATPCPMSHDFEILLCPQEHFNPPCHVEFTVKLANVKVS